MKTVVFFVLASLASAKGGRRKQNLPRLVPLSSVETLTVSGVKSATLENATLVEKDEENTGLYVQVSSFHFITW
jgi:hypothetical protein